MVRLLPAKPPAHGDIDLAGIRATGGQTGNRDTLFDLTMNRGGSYDSSEPIQCRASVT